MSDENDNNDGNGEGQEGATPPADDKSSDQEVRLSQAAFDAIIKREKAQARRAALAESRKKSEPEPKTPTNTDESVKIAELAERLETVQRNLAFSDFLSRMPGAADLNDDQRGVLLEKFDPADPKATVKRAETLFGAVKRDEPKGEEDPKPNNGIPFVAGAPSSGQREPAVNPVSWSRSDIESIKARGPGEMRKLVEQWRSTLPGGQGLFRRKVPKG